MVTRSFPVLLTAVLALLLLLAGDSTVVAKKATPTPTPTPAVEELATETPTVASSAGSSSTAAAATSPAPAPSPSPVPIHSAQVNSDTFRVTDNLVCPDMVAERINAVYAKNKKLFVTCMEKSGYQIFPYSGKVPTAQDITLMVQSPECMAIITAVAMADFPACSLGDMPIKAVVETLLKISVDMADGEPAPSPVQFHALMAWRRDVNAAQQAGVPYDSDSELYAIFKKALARALSTSGVRVLANLTITYPGSTQSFTDTTGSSLSATAGTVKAGDTSSSSAAVKAVSTPAASEVLTRSSPASSQTAGGASSLLFVVSAALAVVAGWTA